MKKGLFSLTLLLFLLASCAPPTQAGSGQAVVFTDALGSEVSVSNPSRVIVSPASFVDIWQLAGGTVMASTEDAFESALLSEEDAVSIGGVQSPNLELILAQDPDFVVLSQTTPGHAELYEALSGAGVNVAYFAVETFDDYLAMLKTCTDITGQKDLYEKNGVAVRETIEGAIAQSKDFPTPTVLFIRSYSSGISVKNSDSMTGAMLKDLGCINIADKEESLLEELSMEVIIREDPDFIFVTTMGSSEEKALKTLQEGIQKNPAWSELSAVKNGRYHVLPKELFHLKPNARWGESYEILANILYET